MSLSAVPSDVVTAVTRPSHSRSPSGNQRIFKALTRSDAETAMSIELDRLLQTVPDVKRDRTKKEFDGFKHLFRRYLENSSQQIDWEKIQALDDSKFINYEHLSKPPKEKYKELLNQLIVIKLNGGLGTTMGCTGAKSLISVRNDCTFLDLTVQQIARLNKKYGCHIPLVLMNSFNTQEETSRVINKYNHLDVRIYTFEQSRFPRIVRELLLPMATVSNPSEDDQEAWYPPGHGDVYRSFVNCNLAEQFSQEGKRWVFISNIDNLGATVSPSILQFLEESHSEFVMEVTDKTRADVKGGTLVNQDGKLRLLEIAQVPKKHVDEFSSVRKFRIFNTNNIWVSLQAMRRQVANEAIDMEIIINPKTLDNGLNILQLEEAVGAAIKSFDRAVGLKVPRSRFLPVKTTSDLLLLMSDLYMLKSGKVVVNKTRMFPTVPLVKLGTHFKKVKDFLDRFATIPNMLELDHLTVSGDVTFGNGVQLRGTVIIIANHGDRIDIPPGAILENKIVSGNLRILDH